MVLLRRRQAKTSEPMVSVQLAALMAANDAAPASFNYDENEPGDVERWGRIVEALILGHHIDADNVLLSVPGGDFSKGFETLFIGDLTLTGPRGVSPASQVFGKKPIDVDAKEATPPLRLLGRDEEPTA